MMVHRRTTGEADAGYTWRAGKHGAGVGLLALRTLIVCGLLGGCAVAAIMAAAGRREATAVAAAQVASPLLLASRTLPAAPTVAFAPKPAKAAVQQIVGDKFAADEAAVIWARRIPDDVLKRDLAKADDVNAMLHFGRVSVPRRIVETIVRAARETGADPALLMAIADKESSFSPGVKAHTSSATGLFQFIDTTWLRVIREFGPQHGLAREAAEIQGPDADPTVADPRERARILALRKDPYLSALMAAEMLNHDGGEIARSIGRDLTDGEAYLTHFLGPQDATLFMEKVVEDPKLAAAKLLPKPARANRPIFFGRGQAKPLSLADVRAKFDEMMGSRVDRFTKVDQLPDASAYTE